MDEFIWGQWFDINAFEKKLVDSPLKVKPDSLSHTYHVGQWVRWITMLTKPSKSNGRITRVYLRLSSTVIMVGSQYYFSISKVFQQSQLENLCEVLFCIFTEMRRKQWWVTCSFNNPFIFNGSGDSRRLWTNSNILGIESSPGHSRAPKWNEFPYAVYADTY